jgi:hypothetical protein
MKTFVVVILLFFGFGSADSAEEIKIDCTMWRTWNNDQKTMYLAGYNDAIGIAAFGGAAGGGSPEDTQKLIHTLWPRGYNLGNLGDELNRTPQFRFVI